MCHKNGFEWGRKNLVEAVVLLYLLFQPGGISFFAAERAGPIAGQKSNGQCTSFCLDSGGHALFGANYDFGKDRPQGLVFVNKRNVVKSFWESDPVNAHASWTSRYGSVSFNLVMSQLSWAGMNEAGLVISTMELSGSRSPAPDSRPWIYSNYWLQYILDNCATIEEVIACDSIVRIMDYVDHYLVCDRSGRCATIEFLDGKMVCHTGNALPVKVLANSTYEASIEEWNRTKILRSRGEAAQPANLSLRRFVLAADRASAFKSGSKESSLQYAFATLEEVSGQRVGGSPTLWSLVFDTESRRVHFRTIVHPAIRSISLKELDFSCRTPGKMIDINEKISGDITARLRDYSSQMHFDHALAAWKRWGSEMDAESLRQNIRFIEAFPCQETSANEFLSQSSFAGDIHDAVQKEDLAMVRGGAVEGMVFIPGGFFNMGSEDGDSDEKPVQRVWVDGFWMDRTEVTNKYYCEFLNAWGKTTDASGNEMIKLSGSWNEEKCRIRQSGRRFSVETGYENHPVIYVTWYGASQYAKWANKRLPTEAEWEYAARAGNQQLKYSWANGDPAGKKGGNIADMSGKRKFSDWTIWEGYDDGFVYAAPVGSFEPNPFGLYDMTGNVWELCAAWYDGDYFAKSPKRNPQGPSSGLERVLRGGAWGTKPMSARCSNRHRFNPLYGHFDIGFRCVRNN